MRRGDVWWARIPVPSGRRPVVLVSRESAYAARHNVTVVEVSRTVRGIASEVPLGKKEGLPTRCVANADNVLTIPKDWLSERIAALPSDKLHALDEALAFSLGLQTPPER